MIKQWQVTHNKNVVTQKKSISPHFTIVVLYELTKMADEFRPISIIKMGATDAFIFDFWKAG